MVREDHWTGQVGPTRARPAFLIAGLGSDRCWAGLGQAHRVRSLLCMLQAPLQPVLFLFFKTKEVQKAMDEKRFDEAIQLRGR